MNIEESIEILESYKESLEDSAEANYMMKLLTDIFAAIYKGKETEAEED